ncbi:MAG: FimV/HubP family polar landmark protein, partial [Betaproteobacteria bacterium]
PSADAGETPSAIGVLHDSDDASSGLMELFDAPREHPVAGNAASSHAAIQDYKASAAFMAAATPASAPEPMAKPAPQAATPQAPDFSQQPPPLKIKSHTAESPARDAAPELLLFDLDSLSLDLDSAGSKAEADTDSLDPLATKLALAKEFQSIGDNDGAHALVEEVYAHASGQLRADAKRFLGELGFSQSGFDHSKF